MKKVIFNEERCKSCELCVSVCPKKILRISDDKMNEKGYKPAEIFEQINVSVVHFVRQFALTRLSRLRRTDRWVKRF